MSSVVPKPAHSQAAAELFFAQERDKENKKKSPNKSPHSSPGSQNAKTKQINAANSAIMSAWLVAPKASPKIPPGNETEAQTETPPETTTTPKPDTTLTTTNESQARPQAPQPTSQPCDEPVVESQLVKSETTDVVVASATPENPEIPENPVLPAQLPGVASASENSAGSETSSVPSASAAKPKAGKRKTAASKKKTADGTQKAKRGKPLKKAKTEKKKETANSERPSSDATVTATSAKAPQAKPGRPKKQKEKKEATAVTPPPQLPEVWKVKRDSANTQLTELLDCSKDPPPEINRRSVEHPETEAQLATFKEAFCHVERIEKFPQEYLSLVAKLVHDSDQPLTDLSATVSEILFPGRGHVDVSDDAPLSALFTQPKTAVSKKYEVEQTRDVKITASGEREYLIKWIGYPEASNTWEPEGNLNEESLYQFWENRKSEWPQDLVERLLEIQSELSQPDVLVTSTDATSAPIVKSEVQSTAATPSLNASEEAAPQATEAAHVTQAVQVEPEAATNVTPTAQAVTKTEVPTTGAAPMEDVAKSVENSEKIGSQPAGLVTTSEPKSSEVESQNTTAIEIISANAAPTEVKCLPCPLSLAQISEAITQAAARQNYGVKPGKVVRNEDTNVQCFWRWDAVVIEHLPKSLHADIHANRKLWRHKQKQIGAIQQFLAMLTKPNLDQAKLSTAAERVDKNAREGIQLRFKEAERQKKLADKLAKEEVKREAAEKKKEADRKKHEASEKKKQDLEKKKKEDAEKKKNDALKLAEEKKAEKEQLAEEKKQQKLKDAGVQSIMGFFAQKQPKSKVAKTVDDKKESFFLSFVAPDNSVVAPIFRIPRSGHCERAETISAAVHSGDAELFAPAALYKPKTWSTKPPGVSKKIKFLQFYENYRPAYFGTHPGRAQIVRGRRPLAKEPELDYEVDSDDEWGDDDPEDAEELLSDDEDEDESAFRSGVRMRRDGLEDVDWLAPEDEDQDFSGEVGSSPKKRKTELKKLNEIIIGPHFTEHVFVCPPVLDQPKETPPEQEGNNSEDEPLAQKMPEAPKPIVINPISRTAEENAAVNVLQKYSIHLLVDLPVKVSPPSPKVTTTYKKKKPRQPVVAAGEAGKEGPIVENGTSKPKAKRKKETKAKEPSKKAKNTQKEKKPVNSASLVNLFSSPSTTNHPNSKPTKLNDKSTLQTVVNGSDFVTPQTQVAEAKSSIVGNAEDTVKSLFSPQQQQQQDQKLPTGQGVGETPQLKV
mmetsp:Transcript_9698/g.18488  ORF Transcript_9698/g.18488 Transcript_9698/m.18488 type:complete len:1235 (-) Transcript_9698:230-3934(-)